MWRTFGTCFIYDTLNCNETAFYLHLPTPLVLLYPTRFVFKQLSPPVNHNMERAPVECHTICNGFHSTGERTQFLLNVLKIGQHQEPIGASAPANIYLRVSHFIIHINARAFSAENTLSHAANCFIACHIRLVASFIQAKSNQDQPHGGLKASFTLASFP